MPAGIQWEVLMESRSQGTGTPFSQTLATLGRMRLSTQVCRSCTRYPGEAPMCRNDQQWSDLQSLLQRRPLLIIMSHLTRTACGLQQPHLSDVFATSISVRLSYARETLLHFRPQCTDRQRLLYTTQDFVHITPTWCCYPWCQYNVSILSVCLETPPLCPTTKQS